MGRNTILRIKYIIPILCSLIIIIFIWVIFIKRNETIFEMILKEDLPQINKYFNDNANVEITDHNSRTPLHYAAFILNLEIIKCLIDSGANINAKDKSGRTPIFYVLAIGYVPDSNVDSQMHNNLYKKDREAILQYFVESGADINVKDKYGSTLLHFAYNIPSLEAVEYILNNGADVNARDNAKKTPIFYVGGGDIDLLVKYGAEVNAKSYIGETPLHCAVIEGDLENTKKLIAYKADVNAQSKNGNTPLMEAIVLEENEIEFCSLLLKNKADVNIRDVKGHTALYLAKKYQKEEIIDLLLKNNAKE